MKYIILNENTKELKSGYTQNMMRIENFGQYLKNIRGKMAQSEFAQHLGISQTHLSNLEIGRREPTIALLLLLAQKNGVDIHYWFEDESSNPPQRIPKEDVTAKEISTGKPYDVQSMTVPEIIALQAQIRVYLDNIQTPIVDYDRRMLSDILAACQRALDHQSSETQNVI